MLVAPQESDFRLLGMDFAIFTATTLRPSIRTSLPSSLMTWSTLPRLQRTPAQQLSDHRLHSPSMPPISRQERVSRRDNRKARARASPVNHQRHHLNARREARPIGAGTIAAGPIESGTSGTASGTDGSNVAGTGADPS